MKHTKNEKRKNTSRGVLTLVVIVAAAVAAIALAAACTCLRDIWREQCVITDMAAQVNINSGKLVKGDVVAETFGLRRGANLATIDFARKRAEALARYPAIRDIHVRRRLPDRVEISITERSPVVRLNLRGRKRDSGRVADNDGVVFQCRRGTSMLPTIREAQAPGTSPGRRLTGRALAALRLVEACREPDLQELGVLDVDLTKVDYLSVTLGNYSTAKIAWRGMDDPTEGTRREMTETLINLRDAVRSKMSSNALIWNATTPGYVYSDTKEKIQ